MTLKANSEMEIMLCNPLFVSGAKCLHRRRKRFTLSKPRGIPIEDLAIKEKIANRYNGIRSEK